MNIDDLVGPGPNTALDLCYADACNYKAYSTVVFAGEPTPELVERLFAAFEDGEHFVCAQVDVQHPTEGNDIFERRFPDEEDDHGYTSVMRHDVRSTHDDPTDEENRTFAEFVEACEVIGADGWEPQAEIDRAGGWQDPEKCAALRGA